MPPCDIPGCKDVVPSGLRLCQKHLARQAGRWVGWPQYSIIGRWNYKELGRVAAIATVENVLLLLVLDWNTAGPFEGGEWKEPEVGLAYEFLREHLRSAFGR